jgi:hypothetical protein
VFFSPKENWAGVPLRKRALAENLDKCLLGEKILGRGSPKEKDSC